MLNLLNIAYRIAILSDLREICQLCQLLIPQIDSLIGKRVKGKNTTRSSPSKDMDKKGRLKSSVYSMSTIIMLLAIKIAPINPWTMTNEL